MIDADGRVYVTNSILMGMAQCSTKAALAYVHKLALSEQAAAPFVGTCAHLSLAKYIAGAPKEQCLDAFIEAYRDFDAEHVPGDDRLAMTNVVKVLGNFIDTHPLMSMPFRCDSRLTEITFVQPLADDVVMVGTIDALVEWNGRFYVLDWKTTGNMSSTWLKKFRMSTQITGYTYAAIHQCHKEVLGGFIGAIEIKKVSSADRKCPEHGVKYVECGVLHCKSDILGPIQRTPEQLEAWREEAVYHARRYKDLCLSVRDLTNIARLRMEGTFNESCTLCDFHDYCMVGRPENLARTMFTRSSYDPYKGLFNQEIENASTVRRQEEVQEL